jgi:hypothetical protein
MIMTKHITAARAQRQPGSKHSMSALHASDLAGASQQYSAWHVHVLLTRKREACPRISKHARYVAAGQVLDVQLQPEGRGGA